MAIYAVNRILGWRGRHQRGVSKTPLSIVIIQIVIVALIVFAVTYVANQDRVIIFVVVLLLVLLVGFTFLAERTRFGRYVYAICDSAEAARRTGINVDRIKIDVLMISSIMVGMGGIVLASRLRSVDTAAGGGNLMLNSIAATVRNRGSPEGLFEQ